MSDDMYANDNVDVVQPNEIGEHGPSLHAPDAHRLAVVHHHDADYGLPDTTVTVAEDVSGTTLLCSHGGVTYASGETAVVPEAVADYWVRSGWATADAGSVPADSDSEPEPAKGEGSEPSAPVKAPERQLSAGSGRRTPKR